MRKNIGLYRGKRIDNDEWVKGYLVTVAIAGKRFCLILVPCEGVIQLDGRSLRLALDAIENGRKIAGISDINGNSYFVDPKTVGEYTGLTDKNGKKIFEGDIVEKGSKRGYVVEHKGSWCLWDYDENDDFLSNWCSYHFEYENGKVGGCEIIGNINDNPELLEAADG